MADLNFFPVNDTNLISSNPSIPLWIIPIILTLIALFFSLSLYYSIPWLSEQISLLGLYHRRGAETIHSRRKKVFRRYASISVPLMGSYLVILWSLNIPINIFTTLIVISISTITLLIIRIHGNPSRDSIPVVALFSGRQKRSIIEQHRERVLSFIFGLICTQLIVSTLAIGYVMALGKVYEFQIDYVTVSVFTFAALIALVIITYYGENYLIHNPPENRI